MAMIEFEDHSEENQKALLAYLADEKQPVTSPNRDWLSGFRHSLAPSRPLLRRRAGFVCRS